MITLITPTGDRPEAFKLCEKYIARQTFRDFEWIVLDDSKNPMVCTQGQTHIHTPETRAQGSLVCKMRNILQDKNARGIYRDPGDLIRGDTVVMIEDDDWYAPNYLEKVVERIGDADLYGEGRAMYYNVMLRRWYPRANLDHCSLCATSFKRTVLPELYKQLWTIDPYIDMRMWFKADQNLRRKVWDPTESGRTYVGIKGMPGRKGYSPAHHPRHTEVLNATLDPNLEELHRLIGDDADAYAPFYIPGNAR